MSDSNVWLDEYVLKQMKPVCYGLAVASFAFVMQIYFSLSEGSVLSWTSYGLIATAVPLFGFGTISDVFQSSPKQFLQRGTTKCFLKLLPYLVFVNLFLFSVTIAVLDLKLSFAFSAGAVLMVVVEVILFRGIKKEF